MSRCLPIVLALVGLMCVAGGRKTKHVISFHVQSLEQPGARLFEHPTGTGYYYDKSPVVHWKHIEEFSLFNGDDGGWGAIFRLTNGGSHSLATAAHLNQGRYMLCVVQSEPRGIIKIDRYVDDGYIVVWEGITDEDVLVFDKYFKRISQIDTEW